MTFKFSDEHFPANGKPPQAFHSWDKKRRDAWWEAVNKRKEQSFADEIETAKREHKRRAGNGGETPPLRKRRKAPTRR